MLCPAKNQSTVKVRAFEQRHQEIELLFRGHGINRVCDRFFGRTPDSDLNHLRITQDPRREPFDLGRKCGGKKQRLSVGGDLFYDPPDIGQETHVEHPIDFIEHENVHVAKMQCALLEMIEQPTRRRDQNIDTALEILALLAVTDTAVHDGRAQIGKAPIIAKRGLDLSGQLARRFQNKTTKLPVTSEQGQDWQREGGGLAGACLCGADQIFARKNKRERAELDRSRLDKPHSLGAAHYFLGKTKLVKGHGLKLMRASREATEYWSDGVLG